MLRYDDAFGDAFGVTNRKQRGAVFGRCPQKHHWYQSTLLKNTSMRNNQKKRKSKSKLIDLQKSKTNKDTHVCIQTNLLYNRFHEHNCIFQPANQVEDFPTV